jgi:1-deoxy-D-xylulose-5-phosphate synthase
MKKLLDNSLSLESLKTLDYESVDKLCEEIREKLVTTVAKNGGHLASNLGTVELTVALHRVFNSPDDKIVWDVGHQSYTHKILTGRLAEFDTIRKENGLAGFPRPDESEHDAFIAGHSSTSISVACGIAEAMRIQGNKDNYAIAVVGDGAMTGGMVYEGLNNGAKERTNLIVILNHNNMSISGNVGGVARHLAKIRTRDAYRRFKIGLERFLTLVPLTGKPVLHGLKRMKDALRNFLYHTGMFDDFGFIYLGPVDGHNVKELERVLKTAKAYKHPIFVHVCTTKGKGYKLAEENPGAYHGVGEFDTEVGVEDSPHGFSQAMGEELTQLAKDDPKICAITAAMKYATGLNSFAAEYPERFFDVGIAEEHAVTFAAALGESGMLPAFAVYSSFLQRSYDQLLHDTSICNTHIVLCIDRAGLVGEDGETHHGLFDVPMLVSIPNVTIYAPVSYAEQKLCLKQALYKDTGIACVRYPRGSEVSSSYESPICSFSYIKRKGETKILIVTYGRISEYVVKALDILRNDGIEADVLRLVKIFPIQQNALDIAAQYETVYFFEETADGGIFPRFFAKLAELSIKRIEVHGVCINSFVKHAPIKSLLASLGLDTDGIVNYVKSHEQIEV